MKTKLSKASSISVVFVLLNFISFFGIAQDVLVNNERYVIPTLSTLGITISNQNGTVVLARNGAYHLDFQADLNLVLYNGNTPIWASGTSKKKNSQGTIRFNVFGIVEIDGHNEWWVDGGGASINRAIWVLQDDGNFVGYSDYTEDANGNIQISGSSFAATMTQGGKKSNRSGRLR